jgi:hypothetical protein
VTHLAEENQQLRGSLAERDQDLAAARAASRELMARLNTRSRWPLRCHLHTLRSL